MSRSLTLAACSIALASIPSIAWSQCNQNCPERRTVTVNASATITADADLAIVHVGYKLYGSDAKTAYANASETSNAIMQALIGAGVAKTAIESGSQDLQHTQPYELQQIPLGSEDRFKRQFTVTQNWTIRVKPDAAAKTLNTAIDAGANESGWIQWTLEDENALSAAASAKALSNARIVAESMLQKSDAHLGHLISVSEGDGPRPFTSAGVAGMAGGFAMGQGSGVGTQPLAISSRRVELRAIIYAIYALE
jgi:hypothetical protein